MINIDNTVQREQLVESRVEDVVSYAHGVIFGDDLTSAESKLVWMLVIERMLKSVQIEARMAATTEWLGLKK